MDEELNRKLGRWMARAQDGDVAAYRELLLSLDEIASRYARAFAARAGAGQNLEWEDAVQEILLAVHEKRRTYDPGQHFLPWFYAIARYKMIDRYRSKKRMAANLPEANDFDLETIADESFLPSLVEEDLAKVLSSLPPKQREAIRLVKIEGLTISEAAARLGIGESDVKVSIHRGTKLLRARFGDG